MDLAKLKRGEIVAMCGGLLLAVAIFLPWYTTESTNPFSKIDGQHTGTFSCWTVHPILRILLLLAALAPFILSWIIVRGHQLSWPRGQVTAVVGLTAAALILYNGLIDRPGDPRATISLTVGWFIALLASILELVGANIRQAETGTVRKPPGTV